MTKFLPYPNSKQLQAMNSSVSENAKFLYGWEENIVRNGETMMMVTSIFSFSHNVFKWFFLRVFKSRICEVKGKHPLLLENM